MVNEYTDDYHPSPLEFTSRIYFYVLYFYGLLRGLSLWNISFFFFSNLYIPPRLQKIFKFMVLRLLENTFLSKDLFTCALKQISPPGFYHHHFRQKEITYFHQTKCFEILFSPAESGKTMELKI